MPGTATAPISFDVLDDVGKVERTITYQPGEYIDDDDCEVLAASHQHSFVPIAHNEHSCPPDCSDSVHQRAPKVQVSLRPSVTVPTIPPAVPLEVK
jgi:hypothetical protein